jgi:hypothetical protein
MEKSLFQVSYLFCGGLGRTLGRNGISGGAVTEISMLWKLQSRIAGLWLIK